MSAWRAVVVDGKEGAVRSFVARFSADQGTSPGTVIVGDDIGLDAGSIGEWLLDLIGRGHHVLLAPAHVADRLEHAIAEAQHETALRVERTHPVAGACFGLDLETFSREVAQAVQGILDAILDGLPAGVRVEDRREKEEESGEGHGVELYAPVHDYRFTLSARVTGPVDGVVQVRSRLADIEAVSLERLQLIEADRPA